MTSWIDMLPADPVPWLLDSAEPAARWLTLTALLDRPPDDSDVITAHQDVMADPLTEDLLSRLSPWDVEIPLAGHDKLEFAPNLISLLADMGVTAADDPRIAEVLSSMLEHQDADGRFQSLGRWRDAEKAVWGALPCDSFAIAETLAQSGFADDARVERAFGRIAADLAETNQGLAWKCRQDSPGGFRGPGRKEDVCPQVTLEALRAFSYRRPEQVPAEVLNGGRVSLRVWRERADSKPYMFGHGRQFKRGKWPATWYSALELVDTLGRFPALWQGTDAQPEDRQAMAEVTACLVAYNFDADGRVTPHSCARGYGQHSFGQKKTPSAFSTARTAVAVKRVGALAADVGKVDVMELASSKGGSGTPLPP